MSSIKNYIIKKIGSIFYNKEYLDYLSPIQILQSIVAQKLFRINSCVPWPCHYRVSIHHCCNIEFDPSDIINFQRPGNHFCAINKIKIGKGVRIGPFCSIVTANNEDHSESYPIKIGDYSRLHIRSIILPGVELGPHTVVGAGSVVTKNFPEGYVTLGGSPAKIIGSVNVK